MTACAYCNTILLFGGKRTGELRFCNTDCQRRGHLANIANTLPAQEVARFVREVHSGACPVCGGRGPVDVHTSYRVWSALLLTSWSSRPAICCRTCGTKNRIGDTAFSLVLGWWGFPWGFLVTPVQLGRNLVGFFRAPDPSKPSVALEKLLRFHLAAQIASAPPPNTPRS